MRKKEEHVTRRVLCLEEVKRGPEKFFSKKDMNKPDLDQVKTHDQKTWKTNIRKPNPK